MKKLIISLVAAVFTLSGSYAYAEADGFLDGVNNKLTRGAINAATGWIEFPAEIIRGHKRGFQGSHLLGIFSGLFTGVLRSAGRTVSGCLDVLTFWAVDPEDNIDIGIPMTNEFAWEEEEEPYDIYDPNFGDAALAPIGNKLKRGFANVVCGIAEVPGQLKKGDREGNIGLGIARGFWYWASREAWGIRDIATSILPTPEDNVGATFDEIWPWDAMSDSVFE